MAVLLLMAACGGTVGPSAPSTGPPRSSSPVARPTTTPSSAPSLPATPSNATTSPSLPPGVPRSFPDDEPARRLPLAALIPPDARPEGSWITATDAGEAILVSYALPSNDPFRAERGLVLWRRTGGDPPWTAVLARREAASAGVLSIVVQIADVTGDGTPDALVSEATGGSGDCAFWRVIDLSRDTWIFHERLCDGRFQPNLDPVGLMETAAVYRPGDPHCCPSAFRTRVLTYRGGEDWRSVSSEVTPAS
jgi:hypothetical protein